MIIWLASYPKSGNTWLRMFLKSYFQKSGAEFGLENKILDDFKSHGFPDLKMLRHLKINFNKFQEIAKNWETLQDYINLNNKTNFLKTHSSMCTVGPHKFTTHRNTKGGIYLVRDPRDVLVSYSNHLGFDYDATLEIMSLSNSFETPPLEEGKSFKKTLLGSWADNYNSWKSYKSSKILIIKYEDMVLDSFNTFKKILNYLYETDDVKVNEEKLIAALKQTDFKELQKMEKKHGFRERLKSDLFFRKGKTGEWNKELPKDLIKKIEKLFHKEMVELGYL
tara:strand:+ start:266 stop:1102 length:837 start_codon:yes stop_codon:yes gene_type:complete